MSKINNMRFILNVFYGSIIILTGYALFKLILGFGFIGIILGGGIILAIINEADDN